MRSVLANHNGYIGYMKHQTTAKLKRLIAKLEAAGETGQMYETAVAELERREEVPA